MKYIKNNLDYAVSFNVQKDGKDKKYEFDCLRIYMDTGNVATTGVTPLDEEDYKWLCNNVEQFKKFISSGYLSLTSKGEGANSVAGKIDELAKENKVLKEQLEQKNKELAKGESEKLNKLEKEAETKDAEIKDLKKQLESLKKKQSKGKAEGEENAEGTEGF